MSFSITSITDYLELSLKRRMEMAAINAGITYNEGPEAGRVYNFSAGPGALPVNVLRLSAMEQQRFHNTGMSVMEMSHRSKEYMAIFNRALEMIRRNLGIPDTHTILLQQGGATAQFKAWMSNLMGGGDLANFFVTGSWSQKALAEAKKKWDHQIHVAVDMDEHGGFVRMPDESELDIHQGATYNFACTNETIQGLQWKSLPEGLSNWILDMSSDVLSRKMPVPWEDVAVAFAGAQKNLGPSGVTLVVVRNDLLTRSSADLGLMESYAVQAKKNSMSNTPPTYAIYILGLVMEWVHGLGGQEAMIELATQRSNMLYQAISSSNGFYATNSNSWTNVAFVIPEANEAMEALFLEEAARRGLVTLKGHRSIGGFRASMYNAMPLEGVEALIKFMAYFQENHAKLAAEKAARLAQEAEA